MATSNDSPVEVTQVQEEVQGQPMAARPEPDDGVHLVHEVTVHTDRVILDPNDPLAVQIPEGVGASTVGHLSPLGEALQAGTAEEQFAKSDADGASGSGKQVVLDSDSTQASAVAPDPTPTDEEKS